MTERRALPSIDALLQRPGVRVLEARHGHDATVTTLRASLAAARDALARAAGSGPAANRDVVADEVERDAAARLDASVRGTLRPVVNATGVVIHTNLGRAPLAEAALARLQEVARGYSTLEYDLTTGARGSRAVHAEGLLTAVTGAEAAVVVNNNAAAVLLLLAAVARGREVLVSRGELVEIGGGFRVPEVMAQSGAALREVGTTNRTRVSDFTASSSAATALWLRVHPSNFRIEGFTERPPLADLVAAAHAAGVPLAEDLGSGNFDADSPWEPTVQASLAAGVDVVCVSADKMLGGPQAGIVLGRRVLVDRLRSHPLMRALRVDKLTYAALEGTLAEHWAGRAHRTVPVLRMLHAPVDEVRVRAEALAARLRAQGWEAGVVGGRIGDRRRQRAGGHRADGAGAAVPRGLERRSAGHVAARARDADHRPHPGRRRDARSENRRRR